MRYLKCLELVGGLLVAAGLFSACSFVHDLSADQCEVNADCDALGGEFRDRECRAGVCVPTGGGPTGGSGGMDAGGCSSTRQCLDDPDNFGPTVCLEGECVPLANPDAGCPLVIPSNTQQLDEALRLPGGPIVFGTFGPVSSGLHSPITRNYDLAFTEFNSKTSGLPGPSGRRGLVAVVCETTSDRSELESSMNHLVDSLQVPGIVPALYADDLQYVFELKSQVPAPPFFMSAFESDSTLVSLPDGGRLWHVLPTGQEVALAYKPLLTRVLESLELSEPARVALITTTDIRATVDMRSTILDDEKGIFFNDAPASDQDDDTFRSFSITTSDEAADRAPVVAALLELQPHVIIAATADEFFTTIYTPLEAQWNEATDSAPKPFYLFSPYHYNSPAFEERVTQVRLRSAGVNSAAAINQTYYSRYLARFRSAYPEITNPAGLENFYDAAYYAIFAAAKVVPTSQTVRGEDLVRGMRAISDMSSTAVYGIDVDAIPDVLRTLQVSNIRLDGTLGPPDFNEDGGRSTPGSVWCVDSGNDYVSDVLRYDSETGELVDEEGNQLDDLPCIADF